MALINKRLWHFTSKAVGYTALAGTLAGEAAAGDNLSCMKTGVTELHQRGLKWQLIPLWEDKIASSTEMGL